MVATVALLFAGCSPQAEAPAIRIRWPHDPETLDPLVLPNQQAVDAAILMHCSLLQVDFSQKQFVPLLAESLPAIKLVGDSLTLLSYRLRPEATWDTGQPVLARDVDFTLKLMFSPGLPNEVARAGYGFIKAVRLDTADPRRFTFVCSGQSPEYQLASGDFPILSEAALDPQGQLRSVALAALQGRPATSPPDSVLAPLARRYAAATQRPGAPTLPGCGPYKLTRWEKDRFLTFQRKPSWWADKVSPSSSVLQARPARLEYAIIPEDATASLALQRGEIDLYPQVPAPEFIRLQNSPTARGKLAFYSASSYDVVTAGFNTRQPALADALTRQALSRLFDAPGLLKATQLGNGQRTVGLVNPADRTNYNDSLPLAPFDPAAAAGLLQRAGWNRQPGPQGGWQRRLPGAVPQRLALKVRYRSSEAMFETIALQFRAAAAQLGIPVTLQPTESSLLTPALHRGDFDVYVRTLKGNPFVFNYAPILHSQSVGQGNLTGYGTPASDQLITAVAAAENPARKAQLLRRFQAVLQADAPLVPLFFLPTRIAASRDLAGLHASGFKPGYATSTLTRGARSVDH